MTTTTAQGRGFEDYHGEKKCTKQIDPGQPVRAEIDTTKVCIYKKAIARQTPSSLDIATP